ncbi:peptidylprolyl isomerase [Microbacterium sp. cx-55]|uniref:peptidylprolyl isomerase n=1 Tax=Microbacterium sp. cx-55 TaxID=2875948 RepID=UPI001DCAD2AC|nr:peptidylprolyl isomerase [Microbacterium sp. cx-55]MBZ4487241.1 peptidylprolyl isomerase [Microbacterium sp. cx-55]
MRSRLLAAPFAALALVLLSACAPSAPATDAPAASGTCEYTSGGTAARDVDEPPAEPAQSGTVSATLQTSAGDIPLTLDADRTPCTVGSFVSLANQDYFSDTTCHRLTTEGIYVLQCGDPSATGMGGPGYRFADELDGSETYPAGTVAMANAGANTNGSQFFLVYEDSQLPSSYTVFGTMDADGLAVVQEIAAAGAEGGEPDGPPVTPVTITSVTIG